MKNTFNYLFVVLATVTIVSCEIQQLNMEDDVSQKTNGQTIETDNTTTTDNVCFVTRSSCDNNLTNDGCEFLSGEGTDLAQAQTGLVEDMLNCNTESPASNCSWWGNYTTTASFYKDYSNCCYPAYALNGQINYMIDDAENLRPSNNYLIINYEMIPIGMITPYGPYRYKVKVTYRRIMCSYPEEKEKIK